MTRLYCRSEDLVIIDSLTLSEPLYYNARLKRFFVSKGISLLLKYLFTVQYLVTIQYEVFCFFFSSKLKGTALKDFSAFLKDTNLLLRLLIRLLSFLNLRAAIVGVELLVL